MLGECALPLSWIQLPSGSPENQPPDSIKAREELLGQYVLGPALRVLSYSGVLSELWLRVYLGVIAVDITGQRFM